MSTHTPTPWKAGELETADGEIYIWNDIESHFICAVRDEDGHGEATEANAALIVRAVNSHAKLVEACRAAQQYVMHESQPYPQRSAEMHAVLKQLREALAGLEDSRL